MRRPHARQATLFGFALGPLEQVAPPAPEAAPPAPKVATLPPPPPPVPDPKPGDRVRIATTNGQPELAVVEKVTDTAVRFRVVGESESMSVHRDAWPGWVRRAMVDA